MLFNSHIFILAFLPVTAVGFFLIGSRGHQQLALVWLVLASLCFYGWWNPVYLLLILASILFNFAVGDRLGRAESGPSKLLLFVGVSVNLAALAYFKYANFFVHEINSWFGTDILLNNIVLPLAISFRGHRSARQSTGESGPWPSS